MNADSKAVFSRAALALIAAANASTAQDVDAYPSKPIRLIVPFSPGGATDNLARTMQTPLTLVQCDKIIREEVSKCSKLVERTGITCSW